MVRRGSLLICSILAASCSDGRLALEPGDAASHSTDTLIEAGSELEAGPTDDGGTDEPDAVSPVCEGVVGTIPVIAGATRTAAGVVFNGTPDLLGAFFCFGMFASGTATSPLRTVGPVGRFDPAAPTVPGALGYGDAAALPDPESWMTTVRGSVVVAWVLPSNPTLAGKTCSDTWSDVRTDPARTTTIADYTSTEPERLPFVAGVVGCRDPARCTKTPVLTSTIVPENAVTEIAYGEPGTTVQGWDRSVALTPMARAAWIRTSAGAFWPLSVPDGGFAVPTSAFVNARFVLGPAKAKPCITCDGRPSSACPAWSLPLSTMATATSDPAAPGRVFVVFFGSPEVASGPGSLRALFVPY